MFTRSFKLSFVRSFAHSLIRSKFVYSLVIASLYGNASQIRNTLVRFFITSHFFYENLFHDFIDSILLSWFCFFFVFASYRYIFISFFLLQYTCTYKFALAFSLPSPRLLRIESCIPTLTKWVSTIVRWHTRGCWTTRTPIYAARSQAAMTVREFHLKRCVYVCVCVCKVWISNRLPLAFLFLFALFLSLF